MPPIHLPCASLIPWFTTQALRAVDPGLCTAHVIDLQCPVLKKKPITLFAFGKAAVGMAKAAVGQCTIKQGIVISPAATADLPTTLKYFQGGHPVPCQDAATHGRAVLTLAQSLGPDDLALVLISGGGSALLELPQEGISLSDIQTTTRALLACGASIDEVNAVRRCVSQLKGGRLARAMPHTPIVNILLSDVIESPLPSIASGPTVQDDTGIDPRDIVKRYDLAPKLPLAVLACLEEPAHLLWTSQDFSHVQTHIGADNRIARAALVQAARDKQLTLVDLPGSVSGIAREQGPRFVTDARAYLAAHPEVDGVVSGGETTVIVKGSGRGGRNQEFVLASAHLLREGGCLMSMGTDGIDGASENAGAFLDRYSVAQADALGLSPDSFLETNNSAAYLEQVGTHIRTGATGTNVTDICLYLK